MKAVVAAFNQEKALVGAFSVITNLRMDLYEALVDTGWTLGGHSSGSGAAGAQSTDHSSDGSTSWTI